MSGMFIQNGNTPAAPGVYTNIQNPPPRINGIASDLLGYVGVASWGPVGKVIIVGSPQEKAFNLGLTMNRTYDLGTHIDIAFQQGANNIRAVRVTDGTDAKATINLMDTASPTPAEGAALTALYSGIVGNSITASITAAVQPNAYNLTISRPGYLTETFSNITGSGSAFWQNLVNAVNLGQGVTRGPSQLVTAAVPGTPSTEAPNVATVYTLAGGTDGVSSSVTDTTLVGSDGPPRTGMYALRGSGIQIGVLCDVTTSTTWSDQLSFGNQEGCDMIGTGAAGQWSDIATAISAKQTAGVGGHNLTVMLGDWIYWNDQTNNIQRKVSPQSFKAATLAALGPQEAGTNKQVYGVVATESSSQGYVYSDSDIGSLRNNGMDVICNPIPAGDMFGIRIGVNTSFNPPNAFDNYTRLTNYVSRTINKAVGIMNGQVQTPEMWQDSETMIRDYLENLLDTGIIEAYSVQVDSQNNPQSQTSLGFMNINISITYYGIAAVIIINFNGGTSVQIQSSTLAQAA